MTSLESLTDRPRTLKEICVMLQVDHRTLRKWMAAAGHPRLISKRNTGSYHYKINELEIIQQVLQGQSDAEIRTN